MVHEPNTTRLILVRHGETLWNEQGRLMGHLDSPLNELGRRQAAALAGRLAEVPFDALYSSDLGRAMATAQEIARRCGKTVVAEAALRERALGVFQGRTFAEIALEHPRELAAYRASDGEYVIPGGESGRAKHERVIACLQRLADAHAGGAAVAVVHSGVLDSAIRHVMGLPLSVPRPVRVFNASLNIIDIRGGRWLLSRWGDICHLEHARALDDY